MVSNNYHSLFKDPTGQIFSPETKKTVKDNQHGRCNMCGEYPTHWEFDHITGRGDNSIENCQGLCLNCHKGKTIKDDW